MGSSRPHAARAAVDVTFEELYRGHRADVFREALRELGNVHDAEDVTQAAFVDAYRAVLKGTQPQSPRAWLLAIAQNVRRRRFRTAERRPRELPLDEDYPLAADVPYEQAEALAEALEALPDEQRRVFVLREISGLAYDEIAEEVESSVASVQMLLFRARRSLREELEPPAVARRRTGLLVPLPGWLTSLASRVELVGLTPRLAGATGATALVVLGASVAVPRAPADIPRPAPPSPQASAVAGAGAAPAPFSARPAAVRPAARLQARPLLRIRSATVAREARPSAPSRAERRAAMVAAEPVTAAPPTATATPALDAAAAPASTPVRTVGETLEPVVERVVPEQLPQVPVQLPVAVPPLPAPVPTATEVVELGAGAASAAGADALPLPVPPVPPVALPQTP